MARGLRATKDDRDLLDRAAAARRVLADSEQAQSFSEHLIPEFVRSPTDPLHLLLLLLLKDIRRTLGSRQG